jgi:hypothetical protein
VNHKTFKPDRDVPDWAGPTARHDLLREVSICFVVVLVLVVALAVVFSSPDERPVTIRSWSKAKPVDFVQTAATELAGTSALATYGPPYNTTPGSSQKLGPVSLEQLSGVHIPINTSKDFVIDPLLTLPKAPVLDSAISTYEKAPAVEQQKWDSAFGNAAANASFSGGLHMKAGDFGPVATMMTGLLSMARSGALDGALLATPQLYGTDYTKPLLFIADGSYLEDLATTRHLTGDQWGMMNETGNFPGQAWLWLYTFWYQIPPMNSSSNGDMEVWAIMMALTVLLALVPFIPGLRSVPRWSRVYRLIWRHHYRSSRAGPREEAA